MIRHFFPPQATCLIWLRLFPYGSVFFPILIIQCVASCCIFCHHPNPAQLVEFPSGCYCAYFTAALACLAKLNDGLHAQKKLGAYIPVLGAYAQFGTNAMYKIPAEPWRCLNTRSLRFFNQSFLSTYVSVSGHVHCCLPVGSWGLITCAAELFSNWGKPGIERCHMWGLVWWACSETACCGGPLRQDHTNQPAVEVESATTSLNV